MTLSGDTLNFLTTRLGDRVSRPGTDRYDRATTPHNVTARQRPVAVVVANSPEDVAESVKAAGEAGLRVVVQATGHGAAGEIGPEALLLDTANLNGIVVDPERRVVTAGAGATMGAINVAAFEHGLLAPGGTAADVGVVGYTANGGVGWLTRPHGLASAALHSVDVVDGAGQHLHADDEHNADVLWAYRGGGGVGVATELRLRLFPARDLYAGFLLWDAEHAGTIIPAWGQALPHLDTAVSSAIGLLKTPDAPMIPEALRGKWAVHLSAATAGGEAAMYTLQKVFSSLPAPVANTLGPCDAARLATIHLDPPAPVPALGEGRWLTAAAAEHALEILTAAGIDLDLPLAELELRHVAVPPSAVQGAQTSVPGEFLLHAVGPAPAGTVDRVKAALNVMLTGARAADTGRSAAAFRDGQETAPDALTQETRDRLREIRRRVDPTELIAAPRSAR